MKSGSVVISVSSFECHCSRVNRKIAQIVIHCGPFSHCLELLYGIEIEGDTSELQNARGHEGRVLEVASHGVQAYRVAPQVFWVLLPGARAEVLVVGHPGEESRRGCHDAGTLDETEFCFFFFSRVYYQLESFREIGS